MTTLFKAAAIAATIAGSAGLGATAAGAATVSLTFNGLDVTPAERVDLIAPRSLNNLPAGGFEMSDGSEVFLAWCIDLFDTIRSDTYDLTRPSQVSDQDEADLNLLFTGIRDQSQLNSVNAAAFQVAIWEIVYEETGSYDLASGDFQAGDNAAVIAQASAWLSNLGSGTGSYDLTFYQSDTSQDLVAGTISPVPAPAGLLLLGSALGALGFARRRF